MKNTIVIVILIALGYHSYAQKAKVYLKNGSIIRGKIFDYPIGDSLLVQIDDSSIHLPLTIVDEVRFKMIRGWRPEGYKDLIYKKGMATTIRSGFLLGAHSYDKKIKPWLAVEVVQEYHYHPLLNGGVGIGINHYENYTTYPLFIEYLAVLRRAHRSVFVYGKAGYSFIRDTEDDDFYELQKKGGILFAGGLGWQKRIGNDFLRIKFGYSSQKIEEVAVPQWSWGSPNPRGDYDIRIRNMNRASISIEYVIKYNN